MLELNVVIVTHELERAIPCAVCSTVWEECGVGAEVRYSRSRMGSLCPKCLNTPPAHIASRLTVDAKQLEETVVAIHQGMKLPPDPKDCDALFDRGRRAAIRTAQLCQEFSETLMRTEKALAESTRIAAGLRSAVASQLTLLKRAERRQGEFFKVLPPSPLPFKIQTALQQIAFDAAMLRIVAQHCPKCASWPVKVRQLMDAELEIRRESRKRIHVSELQRKIQSRYASFLST